MAGRVVAQTQHRLLTTLERLLEIEATEVKSALDQASDLLSEALASDKVDAFLHEVESDSLVAVGTSNTVMGRRQHEMGLDRLALANRDRTAEVFQSGTPYVTGRADQDEGVLRGITDGLGVRSINAVPLQIGGDRRGVLSATSSSPEMFTQDDLNFLKAVGRLVGMLVHRAELVEAITRDAGEQAKRVAAEELVTVLAHDLNNHFTPLKMRLSLLSRVARQEGRDSDVHHLGEVGNAINRLHSLVGDLLDVGRLEQGIFTLSCETVDLVELTRQTVGMLETTMGTIQVRGPASLVVQVDPNRLRQALKNLIANTLRFSPEHILVLVELTEEPRADGRWAVIVVRDKGPGIPPEVLPRLFGRSSPGPGSSGLGLRLVLARSLAGAHGGTLSVESGAGVGTSFQVSLPLEQVPI